MFNAYHLASWKFMRCLQCFLEYEFVLFQIITKKHIHLWSRIIASGTARMELKTTGVWEHRAFFPHFYIANFGGRCIHFIPCSDTPRCSNPPSSSVKELQPRQETPRKTSRICFRNWPRMRSSSVKGELGWTTVRNMYSVPYIILYINICMYVYIYTLNIYIYTQYIYIYSIYIYI